MLNGSGAPSGGLGSNGDFYIDPTAQLMYGPKASGVWPAGVSYGPASGFLPSYASTHAGPFDPSRSVYNATGATMKAWRANLGRARGPIVPPIRVAFLGSSSTAGYATTIGSDDEASQLREIFRHAGYTPGELVWCSSNSSPYLDSRISLGGWTEPGTGKVSSSSASNVLTYTSLAAGTVVEILCTGQSATFSYAIDGGAPVSITATGSNMHLVTVTGLANTTHVVTITGPSSGTSILVAVGVRNTTGICLANAGLSGSTTAAWLGTNIYSDNINVVTSLAPQVAILEMGGNDFSNGVSLATFVTNQNSIITKLQAAGASVFLVAQTGVWAANPDWLTAFYTASDTFGCPLLDLQDCIGTPPADLLVSGHANRSGYAVKVALLSDLLMIPRTNV